MGTTEGGTRQELAEISGLVDANLVTQAHERLLVLIRHLPWESLELVSPDLRALVARFQKQRRRDLTALLDVALAKSGGATTTVRKISAAVAQPDSLSDTGRVDRYAARLVDLRDRHIFQWATFYRETVGYIFKDLQSAPLVGEDWRQELDSISSEFARHSQEIFERGYQFVTAGGLSSEIAVVKSLNGVQRFLYLVINLFLESRESVIDQVRACRTWDVTSALLSGVLRGYGRATLGQRIGWQLLLDQRRLWAPALGFMTGADAASLLGEGPEDERLATVYGAALPALLAMDQFLKRPRTNGALLPRLSRVSGGGSGRLDITLGPTEPGGSGDVTLSCLFEEIVSDPWTLREAAGLRATAIVGSFAGDARAVVDSELSEIAIDASEVQSDPGRAGDIGVLVLAKIDTVVRTGAARSGARLLARNYAREFPLDDPDTRKMYMVERQSVKELLQQFEQGTGIHLWCSVRRSGKTTAANNMADMSGRSVVVYQTMDHQPHQPELNLFERKVTEAMKMEEPLAHDFFSKVVDECTLATVSLAVSQRKVVFVIDEYESLFGTLQAMTNANPDLRFLVALPILSQMVSFATRNLLILMGQRPDAHYILSSQNQLSPLARQHGFPLFAHRRGSRDSEFSQFLRRVLSANLPFGPDFADLVYEETGGHPYLTVNMMIDLCDWMIQTEVKEGHVTLDGPTLTSFVQERLSPAALQRSPHYSFFQNTLNEYLSETSRRHEPWLHAITTVLKQISLRHPRALKCSLVSFESIAEPLGPVVRMTSNQLLASANMANFLRTNGGQVEPAIRLMARLAGCAVAGSHG